MMMNELPTKVIQYLEKNWFGISEEWCPRIGGKILNFMNSTNNRVEGINAKLKSVISLHSSLEEFIENLFITIKSLEKEKKSRLAHNINKRTLCNFVVGGVEYRFSKILSEYALKHVVNQLRYLNTVKFELIENENVFKVATDSNYKTTSNFCDCLFCLSMGLPCKHIFAVRRHLKEDLYDEALVQEKWTLTYILDHPNSPGQESMEADINPVVNYPVGSVEHRYSELVNEEALNHLIDQLQHLNEVKFELSDNGKFFKIATDTSYETTSDSCDCYFSKSMGLPCKHIFTVRQHLQEDLYNEQLVHQRWTLAYILEHQNFLQNSLYQNNTEPNNLNHPPPTVKVESVPTQQTTKVLSQQEKYKCALNKAKCIAHLAAESSTRDFNKIMSAMDKFISLLEDNKHDIIIISDECNEHIEGHQTVEDVYSNNINDHEEVSTITEYNEHIEGHQTVEDVYSNNTNDNEEYSSIERNAHDHIKMEMQRMEEHYEEPLTNDVLKLEDVVHNYDFTDNDPVCLINADHNYYYSDTRKRLYQNETNSDKTKEKVTENIECHSGHGTLNDDSDMVVICDTLISGEGDSLSTKDVYGNIAEVVVSTENECFIPTMYKDNISIQDDENNNLGENEKTVGNINLSNITVPPVFRKRGRPAGSNLTAIGLPSKRKRKLLPFKKLPKHERVDHILSWVVKSPNDIKTRLITVPDLKDTSAIDMSN